MSIILQMERVYHNQKQKSLFSWWLNWFRIKEACVWLLAMWLSRNLYLIIKRVCLSVGGSSCITITSHTTTNCHHLSTLLTTFWTFQLLHSVEFLNRTKMAPVEQLPKKETLQLRKKYIGWVTESFNELVLSIFPSPDLQWLYFSKKTRSKLFVDRVSTCLTRMETSTWTVSITWPTLDTAILIWSRPHPSRWVRSTPTVDICMTT